ncbi:hypothetical protein [Actinomarinicola tropica]|uniref:Blue (type 1) copper domain-containing protein n=1 Tax=Actinomarinicola tropica TaxID=2789776 RepID=A0A5Q2RJ79_9ACTN|nr:hypothetical protein [Actinomarinicola tropica]QGG96829.1 hypothetical protein GH723_17950 [Actinomarinicola tropica]
MHRIPARTALLAGAALVLTASLAGCSDDDDTAEARTVAAPSAVCDAAVDLGAAFGAAPEEPDAFPAFAEDTLVPIGEAFAGAFDGDDELGAAASTLATAFEEIAETGDPSALESDDVVDAQATLGQKVHDDCDLAPVDVTAVDYAYEGVPTELRAGRTSFAMTNEGVEEHEMVLFRLNDGVDPVPFPELMERGEEAMADLTFTGVAFGAPGTTSYAAVDLEPGTYYLVCFIPVGGGEDGPPHFMEGMQHTITVS